MSKIMIVKNGITRSIKDKDAKKWGDRGYKKVVEGENTTPKKPKDK